MGLTVGMVTIDCADPQKLAEFWSAALGVGVQADIGDYVLLERPADGGATLGLQRVPESRVGKNRAGRGGGGGGGPTPGPPGPGPGPPGPPEVPRLTSLGATVVGEHEVPGLRWTVLADPEGNQFCLGEHPE